jgi:hypothetical protein
MQRNVIDMAGRISSVCFSPQKKECLVTISVTPGWTAQSLAEQLSGMYEICSAGCYGQDRLHDGKPSVGHFGYIAGFGSWPWPRTVIAEEGINLSDAFDRLGEAATAVQFGPFTVECDPTNALESVKVTLTSVMAHCQF